MKFRYLIISNMVWGKNVVSKEYFVNAVQRGDLIIDTEHDTYYDKETNSWKDIEGDK